MKTIDARIYVTNGDIHHGISGDSNRCAIARAIERQFPYNVKTVDVAGSDSITVRTVSGGRWKAVVEPRVAERIQEFIEQFDDYDTGDSDLERTSFNMKFVVK
jgi:hypothetical protein